MPTKPWSEIRASADLKRQIVEGGRIPDSAVEDATGTIIGVPTGEERLVRDAVAQLLEQDRQRLAADAGHSDNPQGLDSTSSSPAK